MTKFLLCNCNHSSPSQDLVRKVALEEDIDFVCITEPSLNKDLKMSAPGWNKVVAETAAILIKREIKYQQLNLESKNTVAIKINEVILICTYLSPNKPINEELQCTRNILNLGKRIILTGDFNCRLRHLCTLKLRRRDIEFEEMIDTLQLTIHNNKTPTCIHQGRATINDLVITKDFEIKKIEVLTYTDILSDHIPVIFTSELQPEKNIMKVKKLNENKLDELLELGTPELLPAENETEIQENARLITRYLSDITAFCTDEIPIKTSEKWWTPKLEKMKKKLKKLRRKEHKKGTRTLVDDIKKLRNDLKIEIRKAKSQLWRRFVTTGETWGKPYKIIIKNKKNNTQRLTNEELLRHKFGTAVTSNAITSTSEIIDAPNKEIIAPLTAGEVAIVLKKCKNRSAPGTDGVNYKTLKRFNKRYPEILKTLYQDCLNAGVFPDVWKTGNVIWIPKEGKDMYLASGYRPITLLSTIGKCLEKIVGNRIAQHLKINEQLSIRQFGFTKGKGTEDALAQLLTDVEKLSEMHNFVMVISIDVEAAFDTIRWDHLMKELRKYQMPAYLKKILHSFLNGREVSSGDLRLKMERGCPQGSVLGPVIWNLAYNYVLQELENRNVTPVCYADDTALIIAGPNIPYLEHKAKRIILYVEELLSKAGLTLNLGKTAIMVLNGVNLKKFPPQKASILIHDTLLKSKIQIKYLGMILDCKLEWRAHIENAAQKCLRILPGIAALCHNTYGYNNKARREVIGATIEAQYRYGALFFEHKIDENRKIIHAMHRKTLIIQGRLYRTTSYLPATAITRSMPLSLKIRLHATKRASKLHFRQKGKPITNIQEAEAIWQSWYTANKTGNWTRKLIPEVSNKASWNLDFHTSQALSGHGVFRAYLCKMKRADSPLCECGEAETAEHILTKCPLFAEGRLAPGHPLQFGFLEYCRKCVKKLWENEIRRKKNTTNPLVA